MHFLLWSQQWLRLAMWTLIFYHFLRCKCETLNENVKVVNYLDDNDLPNSDDDFEPDTTSEDSTMFSEETDRVNRADSKLIGIDKDDFKLYDFFATDNNFGQSSAQHYKHTGSSKESGMHRESLPSDHNQPTQNSDQQRQLMVALSVWKTLLSNRRQLNARSPSVLRSPVRFAQRAINRLSAGVRLSQFWGNVQEAVSTRLSCTVCHVLTTLYTSMRLSTQTLMTLSKTICRRAAPESPSVCDGLVESFASTIAYIRTHTKLQRAELCGVLIGSQCAPHPADRLLGWRVHLPSLINRNYRNQNPFYNQRSDSQGAAMALESENLPNIDSNDLDENEEEMLVGQITDLHLDSQYRAFIDSGCGQPVCCRHPSSSSQQQKRNVLDTSELDSFEGILVSSLNYTDIAQLRNLSLPKVRQQSDRLQLAGLWGDYHQCDTPLSTFSALLEQLRSMQNQGITISGPLNEPKKRTNVKRKRFRYMIWTGDLPAHDVWSYSKPASIQAMHDANLAIQKALPGLPVIPVLGNHEAVPINSFAPDFRDPAGNDYDITEKFEFNEKIGSIQESLIFPRQKRSLSSAKYNRRYQLQKQRQPSFNSSFKPYTFRQTQARPVSVTPLTQNNGNQPPPPVYWSLGNGWLYDAAAAAWSPWLNEQALKQVRRTGNYAVNIDRYLRVIVINSNYCARLNPWTLYDPVDPGNQLKFLVRELYLAENRNQRVHLLGHIAPDHRECTQAWLENFVRVLIRFQHVVGAQFYGHTHRDEFRVYYANESQAERIYHKYSMRNGSGLEPLLNQGKVWINSAELEQTTNSSSGRYWWWPWSSSNGSSSSNHGQLKKIQQLVGFSLIAPSVTSYSSTNPAFRIYRVGRKDGNLLDYRTIFFNLTESKLDMFESKQVAKIQNRQETLSAPDWPNWKLEYSAAEVYKWLKFNLTSSAQLTSTTKDNSKILDTLVLDEHLHHLLLQQLQQNRTLLNEYNRRYYVSADTREAEKLTAEKRELLLHEHRVYDPIHTRPFNLILS